MTHQCLAFTHYSQQGTVFGKLDALLDGRLFFLQQLAISGHEPTKRSKKDSIVGLFPVQNGADHLVKGGKDKGPAVGKVITQLEDLVDKCIHCDSCWRVFVHVNVLNNNRKPNRCG